MDTTPTCMSKLSRKRCKHCKKKIRWPFTSSCKICRGQCHRRCSRNSKLCTSNDCQQILAEHPKVRRSTHPGTINLPKTEPTVRVRCSSDVGKHKPVTAEQHSLDIYDRKQPSSIFGNFIRRRHSFSFAFQSRDDYARYQSSCKAELIRILRDHREVVCAAELPTHFDVTESKVANTADHVVFNNDNDDKRSTDDRRNINFQVEDETINDDHCQIEFPRVPPVISTLSEWSIPMEDITFEGEISQCRTGTVYKGKWHGDVCIYKRQRLTNESYSHFLEEVSKFSLIRHENIVLFMGASTDPLNLAIVTCGVKTQTRTLHNQIFVRQYPLGFEASISIARQIAQGLGYLHAKGISIGDLCTRNIFLASKVKVAMTDCTWKSLPKTKPHVGYVSTGHLSYFSPERMRTVCVDDRNVLTSQCANSCPSDMFSYGTILYELFCGSHPFEGQLPEQVVWQLCKGRTAPLKRLKQHPLIKDIASSCWCPFAAQRLSCEEVLVKLKKLRIPKLLLQRQLSLSEPEDIDKLTAFKFRNRSP